MKNGKASQWISIVCAIALLGAVAVAFLPLLQTNTPAGETVYFHGFPIFFGGKVEQVFPSGLYTFNFETNIPMLVSTQALLLSAVACYLAKQSRINRAISMLLLTASIVILCLGRTLVPGTSSLTVDGLEFSYGFYLVLIIAIPCFVAEGASLFAFQAKKKTEK